MKAVFQSILKSPPTEFEIVRVHRALGPKSQDHMRPRDIICRIHLYQQKELILKAAWNTGEIIYEGAHIRILTDVSRATLQ